MNLQVGPKPYTLIESLKSPLKGPLRPYGPKSLHGESKAAEPCTHHYKLLADVYAKQGCVEAVHQLFSVPSALETIHDLGVSEN